MNITKEQLDMILTALEEKRITYQHFYRQARKAGNIDFMEKWETKEKEHMDLITQLVAEREGA